MILIVPRADFEKVGLANSCDRFSDASSRDISERLMAVHRANKAKTAAKLNKVTKIVIGTPQLCHLVNQAPTRVFG